MADQLQLGYGWNVVDLDKGYVSSTVSAIAGNVATFAYDPASILMNGWSSAPGVLGASTCQGNLMAMTSVGTDDWGGALNDAEQFWNGMDCILKFKTTTTGAGGGWKILAASADGSTATGTTEFAWADRPTVSVIRSANRIRVWMNGVKEIDLVVAGDTAPQWYTSTYNVIRSTGTHAGKFFYVGQVLRVSTNTANRYIDPTSIVCTFKVGNATGQYSEFTTVFPAATNTYDDVDDWTAGGDSDGNTTYVADPGSADATYRIYLATADFTPSAQNVLGVCVFATARGNVAAKNTTGFGGVGDGTDVIEAGSVTYFNDTTFLAGNFTFAYSPVGAAGTPSWKDFNFNNLQIGFKHIVGLGADICVLTALAAEVWECTFLEDGGAVGAARRRTGATLMNPGSL